MRRRLLLSVSLIAGMMLLSIFAGPSKENSRAVSRMNSVTAAGQCSVIDPLDSLIQERFLRGRVFFGMRRVSLMPSTSEHLSRFEPDSKIEKEVITTLEDNRWEVAFFLAGRQLLYEPETELLNGVERLSFFFIRSQGTDSDDAEDFSGATDH